MRRVLLAAVLALAAGLSSAYLLVESSAPPVRPRLALGAAACTTTVPAGGNASTAIGAAHAGDVVCLTAGQAYGSSSSDNELRVGATVTSTPGTPAILRGWLRITGQGATVRGLTIQGQNTQTGGAGGGGQPSVFIDASGVTIEDVDLSNAHTQNCIYASGASGPATGILIDGNRIHACGATSPDTRLQHGVYLGHGTGAVIRDNLIYDVADYGVQAYPEASGTQITSNLFDGIGLSAIIIGSEAGVGPTSGVTVTRNIINASQQDPVRTWWGSGPAGTSNVATDNCVAQSAAQGSWPGLTVSGEKNVASAGLDASMMLSLVSPCLGYGPAQIQPAPPAPTTTATTLGPETVTIPTTVIQTQTETSPAITVTQPVTASDPSTLLSNMKTLMDAQAPASDPANTQLRGAWNAIAKWVRAVWAQIGP